MRLRLRTRRSVVAPTEPASLPAVRAERALVALAVHAQQLDDRLARMERRLDDLASDTTMDLPTHEDLMAVRIHSARVAAEVARVTVEMQGRIDDLAVQMPSVVAESRREQRARVLAETIIDLSDSLDTAPVDLQEPAGSWAATA